MRSCQCFLPVFILALLLPCQAVPIEDFFPSKGLSGMTTEPFPLATGLSTPCEQVMQLEVTEFGRVHLMSGSGTQISFTPFLVTSTDLSAGSSYTIQSMPLVSGVVQNATELQGLYKDYYPRIEKDRPFIIKTMLTITWDLKNGTETNVFQVVAAFNETKNSIFVLYQYQDGMMQWSSSDSEVSISVCESTRTEWSQGDPKPYTTFVMGSNVKENGRYAFLYTVDGGIIPAVICSDGCDLTLGTCEVEDTCKCADGYTGEACTEFSCYDECDLNGACPTAPYVCECDNTTEWSGANCTIPICDSCVNGMCVQPYTCSCNPPGDWTGDSCDIPVCTANCVNGDCTAPQHCECDDGWKGAQCTEHDCSNGCGNGRCTGPNMCTCDLGWFDPTCDRANCSDECMINGRCLIPNNCTCDEGWDGDNCEIPICLEGCDTVTGFCEMPGLCNCTEGYIGELCDSTPAPPVLSATEIGLIAGGLIVFVIITAVVVSAIILAIRLC